jgi:hypothetical protein
VRTRGPHFFDSHRIETLGLSFCDSVTIHDCDYLIPYGLLAHVPTHV